MANIYLDVNCLIDFIERRGGTDFGLKFEEQRVFISPLSVHIAFYVGKKKIPNEPIYKFLLEFKIVDFTEEILTKSFHGPTLDLEDNIQLYSAVEADCDYLLTHDKTLLKLKFFGKLRIVESIPSRLP